ncbi:MAG: GNAT family N-acetyltransferase [Candidatus Solibacter sp.]|nr:GNAT family N-acetyltransferase [Candidatus Solibacter sp.]
MRPTVRVAEAHESEEILRITNAAYRVERFFIETDRLDGERLGVLLSKGVFLITDAMTGCVYVELRGERAYFGPLSVDPVCQGSGTGKLLVKAAEEYARTHGCRFMDLRIVNLREELPGFYRKLGYTETGTESFPEDEPTKLPCHLIRMSREL